MTKKTKETNLEHHKDALKKLFGENFYRPEYMCEKIKEELDRNIELQEIECFTDKFLDWMSEPYKEIILDSVEKEYLSAVIKPFREKVEYIAIQNKCVKGSKLVSKQYAHIKLYDGDCVNLPCFKANTMYKGMKINRKYTLEELEEEKMAEMTRETNLEHYKEEMKELFREDHNELEYICKKIKREFGGNIKLPGIECYTESFTDKILDWMLEPYEEAVLDDAEKAYLSAVIKPFREKVSRIVKLENFDVNKQFICIRTYGDYDMNFPSFKPNEMYKGMRPNKEYTLEKLGL